MIMLSRRKALMAAMAWGTCSVVGSAAAQTAGSGKKETSYIAAYDTESPSCLEACKAIVAVHRKLHIPATFFIVGKTLEANSADYRQLLNDPLFEVASHTYSHRMLRDNPFCGSEIPLNEKRTEIFKGKEVVERVFGKPCTGLRPGCGFVDGFRGANDVLGLVREAGFKYTSSLLWGPDYSMPALITEPFTYAPDGYADLWELPGHGWHENLLKNNNKFGPSRMTLWPSAMPEAIPPGFVTTPQEEFAVNRIFIEKAASTGATYLSFIWHPWSLFSFDPGMKMLELTFSHVRKLGLKPCTYSDMYARLSG
ncbi:polysaccharide deacetylase family protein [bacterium]|nr:polysaccharide deacetylase family protein [bacterium]